MTNEHDVLAELKAALDVAPSPAFAASVRERVAADRAPRWSWWPVAAVAASAVAIAIVGIVLRSGPAPAGVSAPVAAAVSAPVPVVAAAPVAPPRAVVANVVQVVHESKPAEPEVLVPADERLTLNRLLLAVRQGRAEVPVQGNRVLEDAEGRMVEPEALVIPLIRVELLPGTPADRSEGRIR